MMSDNAKVQALLDRGGNITIPSGLYNIDVGVGLKLMSNSIVQLGGVVLKAIPTDLEKYELLATKGAKNVTLMGGTILGERDEHIGKTGEWGFGLRIGGGSEKIVVAGMILRGHWGDGIYVSGAIDVALRGCVSDCNRRQGLSVIAVNQLVVDGCTFSNTQGTLPSDGIDLEPDKGDVIESVQILNCKLLKNAGNGIEIAGKRGSVKNVTIKGCKYSGNKKAPLKVENIPNATRYQPTLWNRLVANVFGDYSGYPTTAVIA